MYTFRRILVPSDLSECSRKALRLAMSFAARFDSELFLMWVEDSRPGDSTWEDNTRTASELSSLENIEKVLIEEFQAAATEVANETALPPVGRNKLGLRVSSGDPATEIVKAAEDAAVDLIVMGTHGRSGIKAFFVGSTTERVVERASCHVLAVKPDGYPFLRD